MWLSLIFNKWTGLLFLIGSSALLGWLYLNERELRQLEHKAHAEELERANEQIKNTAATANHNAEQVKLLEADIKRFESATKAAYDAAEVARKDAQYLRNRLKYHGKTSPAFAHCLDIALPDELRIFAPGSRNGDKGRASEGQAAGKPTDAVRRRTE